jgi:hypothetical protein
MLRRRLFDRGVLGDYRPVLYLAEHRSPETIMLTSLQFPNDKPYCIWKLSGQLTAAGLFSAYQERHQDPAWSFDVDTLVDLTDALAGEMSPEQTTRYAELVKAEQNRSGEYVRRSALLVTNPLLVAISSYFEMISADQLKSSERVFTDLADAEAWLMSPHDQNTATD